MKNYKHILEAVNKGIKFALDDFEEQENIQGQTNSKISHKHGMGEYADFMKNVIDLGLPSGTCWFKYNFGCDYEKLNKEPNTSTPGDWYGKYYAWGELEPKISYTKNNYKFYHYVYTDTYKLTKYTVPRFAYTYYTKADNLMQLQPEDDVIYRTMDNPLNIKFNIPTKKQFEELVKYCEKHYIKNYNPIDEKEKINGLDGLLYVSTINGNSIFFPACGNYIKTYKNEENCVTLWTANITNGDSHYATYFYGNSSVSFASNTRYCGYPVRPVINL